MYSSPPKKVEPPQKAESSRDVKACMLRMREDFLKVKNTMKTPSSINESQIVNKYRIEFSEKIDLDENVFDFSDEDNDTNEVISTTSAAKTEKKKEDFDFDFDDI